jgi:hypothetical protein
VRVRLAVLERLIAAADFTTFREIVAEYFRLRGWRDAPSTDGWRDGGSDLSFYVVPGNRLPVAVQTSTEGNWARKLRTDAAKVRLNFRSVTHLTFVSSRRIPERDFVAVADSVYAATSLTVRRIDNQTLASEFFANGAGRLLEILGIPSTSGSVPTKPESVKARAGQAFLLLSDQSRAFRDEAVDTVVRVAAVSFSGHLSVSDLVKRVSEELDLSVTQVPMVRGSVDRLIQRGALRVVDDAVIPSDETSTLVESAEAVRLAEWSVLTRQVEGLLLNASVNAETARQVAAMCVDKGGALCVSSGRGLVAHVAERDWRPLEREARERIREIHAALDETGIAVGGDRSRALAAITRLILDSPLASHLIAGEVFVALLQLDRQGLVSALGPSSELVVLLDASVAIPILACRLYAPTANRFFKSSNLLFDQLAEHGIKIVLPADYSEEVATHMIDAYKNYAAIVDLDEDLRFSSNAFVAHYAGLRFEEQIEEGFGRYLEGLGSRLTDLTADFFHAREVTRARLERRFRQLGIEVTPLGNPAPISWRRAQETVAFATRELRLDRPGPTLAHDTRTIAALFELEMSVRAAHVFATWDSLHLYAYRQEASIDWHVLEPPVLGDLLALVRRSDDTPCTLNPSFIATALLEEDAERGAELWDHLIKIDRELRHDADLIRLAAEFKKQYLVEHATSIHRDAVAEAWQKWRNHAGVPAK